MNYETMRRLQNKQVRQMNEKIFIILKQWFKLKIGFPSLKLIFSIKCKSFNAPLFNGHPSL